MTFKAMAWALGLLAALNVGSACASVTIGQPAPDFSVIGSDGKTHSLSTYKGKTVVLEWTNHDCPFVRKHYDSMNMQTLQKDAAEKGVVWLSVVSSAPGKQGFVDAAQANELTKSRDAKPAAVLLDPKGEMGKSYGAKTSPHMYVIDGAGAVAYAGGIDDKPSSDKADIPSARNMVRLALADIDAGRPVQISTSKPYGCSIKYAD